MRITNMFKYNGKRLCTRIYFVVRFGNCPLYCDSDENVLDNLVSYLF